MADENNDLGFSHVVATVGVACLLCIGDDDYATAGD